MATLWAKIAAGLLALLKPLVYYFVYLAGKKAERTKQQLEQARHDAELAQRYLKNRMEPRTAEDTQKRIDDGTF